MMTLDMPDSERSIAVIGLDCRFPGAANPDAYWQLLLRGGIGIVETDPSDLKASGISQSVLSHPHLVRRFGVLEGIDCFDARAFGIPPARAAALDPQQRILLELAVGAMEHAGYVGEADAGTVGVYVSLAHCSYRANAAIDPAEGFFGLTASDKDYGATRISYALDLTGPSMTIQSACSGAMAAIHMAAEALLSGQCDMALAGGASILVPQGAYVGAPGLMLSPEGACLPFDARAKGTVPGNGAGLVVLKRLDKALADGDTLHAVLLGSAIANDGSRKVDYLAPGIRGQMRAVGEAWSVAGIAPETIGMIEAHGSGTALGDPIEISALNKLFAHFAKQGLARPQNCRIGSVKANIGHLNVASGIAGFIKAVLAVREGFIPGMPGFESPNPEAPFAEAGLTIAKEALAWSGLRRAGVSSFGFGGTNVHAVLQQPPARTRQSADSEMFLLPLSAHDAEALKRQREDLIGYLKTSDKSLADVAYTLQQGRAQRAVRALYAVKNKEQALALLSGSVQSADEMGPEAKAWLAGESLDWHGISGASRGFRIPLPTYPFAKESHWIAQAESLPLGAASVEVQETLVQQSLSDWLVGVFADCLQRQAASIAMDASYDQLGIDSLLIVSITGRIKKRFPEVRSSLLFEQKNLSELAEFLNGFESTEPEQAIPLIKPCQKIAVIGLAARLPGAEDIEGLWDLLEQGKSAIGFPPEDRGLNFDASLETRKAGFIEDIDRFDSLFFGIAPTEARRIDPQARLLLETAWAAIEDAGLTPAALKRAAIKSSGKDVGVFVGVMNMAYRLLAHEADQASQVIQANHWSVANRLSYHFDFNGPSLAIDTACSASLTVLHLASESLRRGECGAALVGGVNLILDAVQQRELVRMGMLSPTDTCHSFGEGANGFVQGEGVGAVVLKTLDSAIADGDRIWGVICGSAINSDGRTGGYTVPNPKAQTAVIQAALANANLKPSSISSIECHGTGTALGDPIEIAGLSDAFGSSDKRVSIGSIKSNMGHLESAAGMASLAKVLLQLEHKVLLPSLNAETPNPELGLERTPFRIQTRVSPWQAEGPLRAGISGFGAGGANAHLILEQAPSPPKSDSPKQAYQPILLSAQDSDALARIRQRLLNRLIKAPLLASDPKSLADLAYTLALGREHFAVREGFVAKDRDSLMAGLSGSVHDRFECEAQSWVDDWLKGQKIDASGFWAGEKRLRLSLPGYPFKGPSLWPAWRCAPRGNEAGRGTARRAPTDGIARGDREIYSASWLLNAERPDESSWLFKIDASMPLLDQHKINGKPYLPGVVSLILALAAHGTEADLKDIVWKKPIEPGDMGSTVSLKLTGQGFRLSQDNESKAEGLFAAASPMQAQVQWPRLGDSPEVQDSAFVLNALTQAGLVHGPALRAIRRLRVDAREALAELVRPEAAKSLLNDWKPCPSLLDSALQAACMILLADPEVQPLPLSLDRFCLSGLEWPDRLKVQARLIERHAGYAKIDIMLADDDGRLICKMQGLTARLLAKAKKVDPVPLFIPRWQALAGLDKAILPEGRIALIAPKPRGGLYDAVRHAMAGRDFIALGLDEFIALPESRRPEVLIYVHPKEEQASHPPHALRLLEWLKAINSSPWNCTLILVTLKVHATRAHEKNWPWAGAAVGLVRTAMKENNKLNVVCLDLDDTDALPEALHGFADHLSLPIAWRNGRALYLRFEPYQAPSESAVGASDHILIAGGAGGIGMALYRRLGLRHGARFTLIGRRPESLALAGLLASERPVYIQADVTDPVALDAAVRQAESMQGPVTGAIHAAFVMEDKAIRNMSADDFMRAFEVKRSGLINLHKSLQDKALRWLCVFSSVNTFVANAGQSNYVAGCQVIDCLGARLAAESDFKVRIINWGYWGEVGRVATEDYRKRMARIGVNSIGVEEGLDALESILSGPASQVLAIRAEAQTLASLGCSMEAPLDNFEAANNQALALNRESLDFMAGATDDYKELDRLSVLRLSDWWKSQGLMESPKTGAQKLGLAAEHQRQFDALIDMLQRHGLMENGFEASDIQAQIDAFLKRAPQFAAHIELLDVCLSHYAETLRGDMQPTEVLFPDMSMHRVEAMYRGNRMVDHFNQKLAQAVSAVQTLHPGPDAFKILEFGSGTGGTSQRVLPGLKGPVEYDYTDISQGFLMHGKQHYGNDYPFMRFKLLNLEHAPDPADFKPASYDIAFGANVIHATRNLSRSLSHVASLIKPGGLLMLYEMVANHDFVTITFGLLPGWWLSEDERLPHGPLLGASDWKKRLMQNGFDRVSIIGQPDVSDEAQASHALIIARRAEQVETPKASKPERYGLLRGRLRKESLEADGALEAQVLECVANTLEIPIEKLDATRSLADYGADSILGVQLVRDLNKCFGVTLKPTTLFSHPSVRAVAQLLLNHHGVRADTRIREDDVPGRGDFNRPGRMNSPLQSGRHFEDAIAVIGLAGQFPGAKNMEAFESLLMQGVCSVGPVPSDRWDHSKIYDPKPLQQGLSVCPKGGFLEDAMAFDPGFFGLSPMEAVAMDPQQRLFLLNCWQALEDAGLQASSLKNLNCGVYAGAVAGDYHRLLEKAGHRADAHSFMGSACSMLPARIAYHLDLKGPAISIDTACSSSLVAIVEASEALRSGRCDLALAGGVAVMSTPDFYVVASNAGMLSPTGLCHTLDEGADGFVPGEAVGVAVLKRLDQAISDRNRILGVIRGYGTNQDGASNGITAPSAPSQSRLIKDVQQRFAIDASSIDYVELHGTGTRLGDPVELEGLIGAFGDADSDCGVGSVKSNIGHSLAASGVAGLSKVLIALKRETIPSSLHLNRLNPEIKLDGTPFKPMTQATPWPKAPGRRRRAGVSAFGFAGTNAHLIVEEAPECLPVKKVLAPWLFVLSAKTTNALQRRIGDLALWLEAHPDVCLNALSFTLATGRTHFNERNAFIAEDRQGLLNALKSAKVWPSSNDAPEALIARYLKAEDESVRRRALEALADRYMQGFEIDFAGLWPEDKPYALSLPAYPFELKPYRPAETASILDSVIEGLDRIALGEIE